MSWTYEEKRADAGQNPAGFSERYAEVTGFLGELPRILEIPERLGGLPVEAIRAGAFARSGVREAVLPRTLCLLGGFAFYHCDFLRRLTIADTVVDYADGVIRQCPALYEIEVIMTRDNWRLPARLLADTDAGLRFSFYDAAGARLYELTFPAFTNDYREDTMARAIHPDIQGTGFSYRACVGADGVDAAGYDALFYATMKAEPEIAGEIALGRLSVPTSLRPKAEEAYRAYLEKEAPRILLRLIASLAERPDGSGAEREMERLAWLLSQCALSEEAFSEALFAASEAKLTQVVGVLMNGRPRHADSGRTAGTSPALLLEDL